MRFSLVDNNSITCFLSLHLSHVMYAENKIVKTVVGFFEIFSSNFYKNIFIFSLFLFHKQTLKHQKFKSLLDLIFFSHELKTKSSHLLIDFVPHLGLFCPPRWGTKFSCVKFLFNGMHL